MVKKAGWIHPAGAVLVQESLTLVSDSPAVVVSLSFRPSRSSQTEPFWASFRLFFLKL
jgi:hypothetical protein